MNLPGAGNLSAWNHIVLALILANRLLYSTLNIGDISGSHRNNISSLILRNLL